MENNLSNYLTSTNPIIRDLVEINQLTKTDPDYSWITDTEDYDDAKDQQAYIVERLFADGIKVEDIDVLKDVLNYSSPSDYIRFTKDTKQILTDYIRNNLGLDYDEYDTTRIPNDIFVANTVPLKDFIFVMTIYNEEYSRITSEFVVRFLFYNSQLFVVVGNTQQSDVVSAVKLRDFGEDRFEIDDSVIYCNDLTAFNNFSTRYQAAVKTMTIAIANHMLSDWYAVQIMLLNPVIKERLFVQGKKEKVRIKQEAIVGTNRTKKARKRKAQYVRYKDISNVILKSDVIRKQHTLCWYVIGHYRHYSSGKKTWINGYWKGPLRELQKNLDEGRERILAQ